MHQTIDRRHKKLQPDETDLKELIKAIFRYKWSIFFITLIALIIVSRFLYFKTPIYNSHALIEVKASTKGMKDVDIIGSAFSDFGAEKVDKEIEILKTFLINNLALNKVNFHIRYFKDKEFKKVEIYDKNSPVKIKDLTIKNNIILWQKLKIIPLDTGFQLHIEVPLISKFKNILFHNKVPVLDENQIYSFGKPVENDYFKLTIEKKHSIETPIYFILNNNRKIYEAIRGNLNVLQINSSAPLIEISFQDNLKQRANEYVNAIAESFISQSIAEKSKRNDRIINFILNQLAEIKAKLDTSEEKLEKYRIEHQAIEPTLQARTFIKELSAVEIELSQNKLKEVLIENILQLIKYDNDIDAIAPLLIELHDQSTLSLITKLQEAQIKEEGLKAQYSQKHPGWISIRKQIRFIQRKIILNIKNLKLSIGHRNENLKKLKKSYEEKLKLLPTKERILINLKRDYEVSSQTYNYLLKKKSENEMIKVAVLSDYRIIDHAYNNGKPIGLKPSITIIIILILGLILGIIQALIRNYINDTIMTKEDITSLTNIPIYGLLPKLKQKEIKLEVLKDSKSPFAESYRSLRTNLQFSAQEKSCNVILVTSTIMAEGKSTTAANLGAIFQMADYKCIVINMDLRKPTLHNYFEINNNLGMSTYLSGKNSIREIIHPTIHPNLDIIPSGPIPPNPSELILSTKMDELLDSLKEVYDYIIIDSAPLGLVTDTMHLMQYADMKLIVAREGYSRKIFISDLNALVEKHELKHIGIVINAVDIASSSYGYGYGYDHDKS